MKHLLISLCLLCSMQSIAGGFRWPNVNYTYAKLYLFNIPFEGPEKLDYHIYAEGVYAKSKIGNGFDLNEDFLTEFHSILAKGVVELNYGLSKCFIPRHGIIYYDQMGVPVASISACFECGRIDFWSKNSVEIPLVDPESINIPRAEEQLEELQKLFANFNYPRYEHEEKYIEFRDSSSRYANQGEMFFHENKNDTIFNALFSKEDVLNMLLSTENNGHKFRESEDVKFTNGGDKYVFITLKDENGSTFLFDGEESPTLVEATVVSNYVHLPNGVQIGMSLDEVINTMGVYDGIAWPEHIQLIELKYTLDYYFEDQTLVRIDLHYR